MNLRTRTGKTDRLILDRGSKFGKWTIICQDEWSSGKGKGIYYIAQCECGVVKSHVARAFTSGITTCCLSCRGEKFVIHGKSRTPIHCIWKTMTQRCTNPNNKAYSSYGGRGITICERWKSFENFFEDMGEYPIGLQLDRIDNNGNYEPNNCHWVTAKENCNNRRKRSCHRLKPK